MPWLKVAVKHQLEMNVYKMSPFKDKTALITGGTGSFGRTVCNYLREQGCGEIRVFSRDELKQELMRIELNDPRVKFYLGDIRDEASIDGAIEGADLVFHAAALKQVPSCEFFPIQAVKTNVVGSENVIRSAIRHGVDKLVCLSTDKAVYPVNAMGMTKALMEKAALAASRDSGKTTISCVRYGNVMYSRGSVIPLFIQQIRDGKPLTITDGEMTRFLLPLRDALDLVLFAFEHSRSGDIFIKKAPACTVIDLVTALKNLFGADNPVAQIGTRHGEKVYETLATREELVRADDLGDYYRVPMDGRDLNYGKFFTEGSVVEASTDDYHSHNTRRLTVPEIETLLLSLPEVVHQLDAHRAAKGNA